MKDTLETARAPRVPEPGPACLHKGVLSGQWPEPWNVTASSDANMHMDCIFATMFASQRTFGELAPANGASPPMGRGSGTQRAQKVAKRLVREAKHVCEQGLPPRKQGVHEPSVRAGQSRACAGSKPALSRPWNKPDTAS